MKKKLIVLFMQLLFRNVLFGYCHSECTTEIVNTVIPECDGYNANVFAEGSVLYWHPKVYGTEFASESIFINDIFINVEDEDGEVEKKLALKKASTKGCVKSANLHWDWGFKVGVGYRLPCYDWNISVSYIAFDSSGCESTTVHMTNEYIANFKSFLFNSFIPDFKDANAFISRFVSKRAKSKIYMNSDTLRLNLGKSFSICESLVLEPKIGFEYLWITLRQNSRYFSVQPFLFLFADPEKIKELKSPFFDYAIRDRSKFSGIGPHFSFETQWYLYNNLCLYGNVSGTILWGLFKICHKEKMNMTFAIEEFTEEQKREFTFNNCMNQLLHTFIPSVNTQIGLAYNTSLNCDKIHFLFRLAFDAQYFWRINQILQARDYTVQYERISEDISMHGVTFDIRVDF